MELISPSYASYSVTLPNANQAYSLAALLAVIDANYARTARELSIQASNSVAGTVRVGDSNLSAVRCGYELPSGAGRVYRDSTSTLPILAMYLMGSVNNMVVNVEVCQ